MKRKKLRIKIARFMIAVMLSTMLSSTFSSVAFARELAGLNSPDGDDVVSEDVMDDGEDLDGEDLGDEDLDDEDPGDEELDDEDLDDEDLDDEDLDDEDLDDEDLDDEDLDDEDLDDEDLDDEDLDDEDLDDEDLDDEDLDDEDLDDEDLDDEDLDDEDLDDEDLDDEDLDDEDLDVEDLDLKDISSKVELDGIGASGKKGADVNLKGLDGWQEEDGETCYYQNGQKVIDKVIKIDDLYYYFDGNGYLVSYKKIYLTVSGERYVYYATEDGSLFTKGWLTNNGGDRLGYFRADGTAYADGIFTIEGVDYYFDYWGEFVTDSAVTVNGKSYIIDSEGRVYEVSKDGWMTINGSKYYIEDGEVITGCIKKIGDYYYGFSDSGSLYINQTFSSGSYYDEEKGWYYAFHYYADEEGRLITNSWAESDWYNGISYYGSDGKAYYNGVYTIDNNKYYFDCYGVLLKNTSIKVGNKTYIAGSDGVLVEVDDNGWTTLDGKKYYFENGNPVKYCVKLIDGDYYGFDDSGCMYDDEEFEIYSEDYEDYLNYKAKSGGKLYVSQWYDNEYSGKHQYYFGPDAAMYRGGIFTIEGNQYYFTGWGDLRTEGSVKVEGITYLIDSEGILHKAVTDGFFTLEGKTFYFENGETITDCVKKIGTSYYGFDRQGVMYDNEYFSRNYYDYDQGKRIYQYYKAQAGGALLINEWDNDGWDLRYYGSDGMAVAGKMKSIDGVNYYFNENAYLARNTAFSYNGKNYYADENGIATRIKDDGWFEISGKKYYIENGELVKNRVITVEGKSYLFDSEGCLQVNGLYSLSDNSKYAADKNGVLYRNSWFERWGEKYYFGDDCKAYIGLRKIDGNYYYFDQYGYLLREQFISVSGKCYILDEKGIAYEVSPNGWTKEIGGRKYYLENGQPVTNCVRKIGSSRYGFDWKGRMFTDTVFVIEDYSGGVYKSYRYAAKENGELVVNGWYGSYYFGSDAVAYTDVICEIEGQLYKFSKYGWVEKGVRFEYNGKTYITDKTTGIAKEIIEGWNTIGNAKYYFVNGEMVRGVYEIDGKLYLFGDDGSLQYDAFWGNKNGMYASDSEGIAKLMVEGFNTVGSKTYYLRNGIIVKNMIKEIDGKLYAFDAFGILIKDRGLDYRPASSNSYNPSGSGNNYYPYNDGKHSVNYSAAAGSYNNYTPYSASSNAYKIYYAGEDGEFLHNTWYYDIADGFWSYFDDTFRKVIGWNDIDGKTYYMDVLGVRQSGFVTVNGKKYYLDAEGVKQSGCWITIGKKKYYLAPSGVVKTGWITVDGSKYYMNSDGVMQTGWLTLDGQKYYLDGEGKKQTGWVTIGGKSYYLDSKGVVQTGWVTVGKKKYYMSAAGAMKTGWVNVDGKKRYFNENGVLQTGWVTIDGKKYYLNSEGAMQTGMVTVNGKKFYLDSKGVVQTGWIKVGSKKYYASSAGAIKTGWVTIEGKKYYFNDNGVLQTGWITIGSKKYYTSAAGAMKTGWVQIDKKWYYFETNGVMVTGTKKIGNKVYTFKANGVCTNK